MARLVYGRGARPRTKIPILLYSGPLTRTNDAASTDAYTSDRLPPPMESFIKALESVAFGQDRSVGTRTIAVRREIYKLRITQ